MASPMLQYIYRSLFATDGSIEIVEPEKVARNLMKITEENSDRTESALLWLSIARKLLDRSVEEVSVPTKHEKKEDERKHEEIVHYLLETHTFIPYVTECLRHKEQLVSYLASQVLSQVLCLPQCSDNLEDYLRKLFPLMEFPCHEPIYCLQTIKHLLKATRTSQENQIIFSFILSHWKECLAILSCKLAANDSPKWPELNFIEFLALTKKIFHSRHRQESNNEALIHLIRSSRFLVMEHLVDLMALVITHCHLLISLKEMTKLCLKILTEYTTASEEHPGAWNGLKSALFVLLESSSLQDVAADVVQHVNNNYKDIDENCPDIVKMSVLRGVVIILMKYGSTLQTHADILDFEKKLTALLRGCSLEVDHTAENVRFARQELFELVNEQDDTLLEVLASSLCLWKKQSLWREFPTLWFCYSCTQVHSLMLEFLCGMSYDHSLLLDFLISSESPQFVVLLTDYVQACVLDWSSLCKACREMDDSLVVSDSDDEIEASQDSIPGGGETSVELECATSKEAESSDTLDKFMSCFIRLNMSLTRLAASKLLNISVHSLVSTLEEMENLYEV